MNNDQTAEVKPETIKPIRLKMADGGDGWDRVDNREASQPKKTEKNEEKTETQKSEKSEDIKESNKRNVLNNRVIIKETFSKQTDNISFTVL